ncbi:MAG TPA: GTP 3',8-cyclase MoaA [Deltaproteobacteria bacterium]|nr:GTP 3',8-cyclase MoaA [Deltaproteobacteria bacterium]HCY11875.1 GTP 3',8-cyclase MoaA [Deltaproteobacteria bacterium]
MKPLVDAYERKIEYLRLSVTDRCNLRCVYCMPPEGIELAEPKNILRYEEMLRLARIAAANGVKKIRVTGGEPLVRKGIVEFLHEIADIPGIEDLSLTTNGVLLKEYARSLKEAGLNRVNVSLDSLKRDRFIKMTRGDNLQQVLDGLDEALKVGLTPVKINMVVIKGFNDDEIVDFALLSRTRPFHVRYIEYMPFNTQEGWQRDKCLTAREIKEIIEAAAGPLEPVSDQTGAGGPARRFRFKGAPGEVGLISPVSEHFCGSCNRLRLTSDGKLRTCLFSDNEVDLRTPLRDGSSDEEIVRILQEAVREKPKGHTINENIFKKCSRTMSLIGG